jgi:hypothetical protein
MPQSAAPAPSTWPLTDALADFTRVTTLLAKLDYQALFSTENVLAIAHGVTPQNITPVFNAFVMFVRSGQNTEAKRIFVNRVRRAVLANNPTNTWEEFFNAQHQYAMRTSSAP